MSSKKNLIQSKKIMVVDKSSNIAVVDSSNGNPPSGEQVMVTRVREALNSEASSLTSFVNYSATSVAGPTEVNDYSSVEMLSGSVRKLYDVIDQNRNLINGNISEDSGVRKQQGLACESELEFGGPKSPLVEMNDGMPKVLTEDLDNLDAAFDGMNLDGSGSNELEFDGPKSPLMEMNDGMPKVLSEDLDNLDADVNVEGSASDEDAMEESIKISSEEEEDTNDVEDSLFIQLLRKLCCSKHCMDEDCLKAQKYVSELERDLESDRLEDTSRLIELIRHNRYCDELCCPLPFCHFVTCLKKYVNGLCNSGDIVSMIKSTYRCALLRNPTVFGIKVERYVSFATDVEWPSGAPRHITPQQEVLEVNPSAERAWQINRMPMNLPSMAEIHRSYPLVLDHLGKVYMPRYTHDFHIDWSMMKYGFYRGQAATMTCPPFHMAITQVYFASRADTIEDYLRNVSLLKQHNHRNLAKLLGVAWLSDNTLIFKNLTIIGERELSELTLENPMNSQLCYLMKGIVDGAIYLNRICGLYYLKWDVGSIKYDCTVPGPASFVAKLCDFSCVFAVDKNDRDNEWDEDIPFILPFLCHSCIAKELLEESPQLGENSEVFGIASVFFCLLAGVILRWDYRHLEREEKWMNIKNEIALKACDMPIPPGRMPFLKLLERALADLPFRIGLDGFEQELELLYAVVQVEE